MMAAPDDSPFFLQLELADEAATKRLAKALAPLLRPGDVLALGGDLGAGKTSFARALINALPGPEEEVPSPTFTLVQLYERGPLEVWHVDLYRLEDPEDALELGLEEAFAEAVTLIEWPERLGPLLPARALKIALTRGAREEERLARLSGPGAWGPRLAELAP